MPVIKRVGALDDDTLDVELTNGQTLLFAMEALMRQLPYAALRDPAVFCCPQTDGESIFWPGGIRLSLETMMKVLMEEKQWKKEETIR